MLTLTHYFNNCGEPRTLPHEGEVRLLDEQLLKVVHHLGVHHHPIHGRGKVSVLVVLETVCRTWGEVA